MEPRRWFSPWPPIFAMALVVVIAVMIYKWINPAVPKSYVLPNDNFNQATMNAIWGDIHKWNVESTPQDHRVYVLTGGLRTANPIIMYADSTGNFSFATQPTNQPNYQFTEWATSPANWTYHRDSSGGVSMELSGTPVGKRIPWNQHETPAGQTYFEWEMSPNTTWYYFKHGKTYITIQIDHFGSTVPTPFPRGVMTHLKPLGNPVN